MHRIFARLAPVAALLLVLSGCGSDDTPTAPDQPVAIVELFPPEGLLTLTTNGARTHSFPVTQPSQMEARLLTLTPADASLPPESAVPIGVALGTWNGSICQIVLADDATKQGDVVPGNTSAAGDFCVRIYDASGTMPGPQNYQIQVTHF